jgi:hypothetical protein
MERMPDPMSWLAAGVPLTLLIDLLDEAGPHSATILVDEPADLTWLGCATAA